MSRLAARLRASQAGQKMFILPALVLGLGLALLLVMRLERPSPPPPAAPPPVTDLATLYKAEAHERDLLLFEVGVMDFNKYGGDITFRVSRPADATLVALAKNGFVFFDYQAGKVTPMPEAFRARFPGVNQAI